jgi:hypothetical protein
MSQVSGDRTQPGAELAWVLQLPEVSPGPEESLLGQLLARADVAGGAVRNRTNQRLIPADDSAERILAPGPARLQQLGFVCHVVHGQFLDNAESARTDIIDCTLSKEVTTFLILVEIAASKRAGRFKGAGG